MRGLSAREDYSDMVFAVPTVVQPLQAAAILDDIDRLYEEIARLRPLAEIGEQVRRDCFLVGNSWWKRVDHACMEHQVRVARMEPSTVVITEIRERF